MGSVSSVVNGNSVNSKHLKSPQYRTKEGAGQHRKSEGCNLDGLLKCRFAQDSSSSSAHHSKGLAHSRSGRSEDFFYIKVSHKPRPAYHRETPGEESVTREGASDRRQHPKLLFMPGKVTEGTLAEKTLVHSAAFKSVNTTRATSTEGGQSTLDQYLCPLRKKSNLNVGQKQDTLATLSDSGRNSMSSLPTHSTSGSLRASAGHVCQNNGASVPMSSRCQSQQNILPPWLDGNTNLNCSTANNRPGLNRSAFASNANNDPDTQSPTDERTLPETAAGIRSPISTDESLIEHLEQRLLERETELQELQVSLEEKEVETCRLFEERQKHCTEEMYGLKDRLSTQLQDASNMAAKTQQVLELQISQLQADNEKLQDDVSKLIREKELAERRLRSYETESNRLVPTLEETQWEVCQKTGEISLLKQQLRESQADVCNKLNEIVSLRALVKENTARVETLQRQNKDYQDKLHLRTREAEVCQNELQRKKNESDFLRDKVNKLEEDMQGMQRNLATSKSQMLVQQCLETEGHSQIQVTERPTQDCESQEQDQELENKRMSGGSLQREVERLRRELSEEKSAQERLTSSFEQEKKTWNKEKEKVIKYQKQLQVNYLQMHKKNQNMERKLKELTAELESREKLALDLRYTSGLQTYDDVIATEI